MKPLNAYILCNSVFTSKIMMTWSMVILLLSFLLTKKTLIRNSQMYSSMSGLTANSCEEPSKSDAKMIQISQNGMENNQGVVGKRCTVYSRALGFSKLV